MTTPATTSTCSVSLPAIVTGINRRQLCHPEVTVNQKWVGASYCFVEFPLASLAIQSFALLIPAGIDSLDYGYAVRTGNRRYFLSSMGEVPIYAGEPLYSDAVLEVWNKQTTPETVTIPASCFNMRQWMDCKGGSLEQLTGAVNKNLWIQLHTEPYQAEDDKPPQFLHVL